MKLVVNLIQNNHFFYRICLIMLAFIATYLCLFSRVDGFILLNSFHTQTLHSFFNSVTFIGDGLFTIILSVIIVVFYKKHSKLALLLIIAYLSSGIFAQIFKAIIYAPRPAEYFKLHNYNYYLDTFANSRVGTNSFPSGHASSAFAMVTIFSIYCKRKFVCYSFLLIGILAGYSRIYLAHHFLIDVFGGAILGILFGSLTYIWIDKNWNAIVGFFTQKIFRSISRQIPNMPSIE